MCKKFKHKTKLIFNSVEKGFINADLLVLIFVSVVFGIGIINKLNPAIYNSYQLIEQGAKTLKGGGIF